MLDVLKKLNQEAKIHPPPWLIDNTQYMCMIGSVAYGVTDVGSDVDVYGWCVPKKEMVFPHLAGDIEGFGKQKKRFSQWQEHHVKSLDGNRVYDFSVYSIVKFFSLCMDNNPNMLDALFVPQRCVLHMTPIAGMVRENRRVFLHKGAWPKFKGYAYSQLHKIRTKNPEKGSKRASNVEKFGYDVKFAYHVVRLMLQIEQILVECDLDLERNREVLKAIRRGEWAESDIFEFFKQKEKSLEVAYNSSKLPWGPQENDIKTLLLDCLEHVFGDLSKAVRVVGSAEAALQKISEICARGLS